MKSEVGTHVLNICLNFRPQSGFKQYFRLLRLNSFHRLVFLLPIASDFRKANILFTDRENDSLITQIELKD